MTMPLVILAVLAVVAGFLGIPEVFAKDAHWLEHFLAPIFAESTARQSAHGISHSTEYALMGGTVAVILGIVFFAIKNTPTMHLLQRLRVLPASSRTSGMWMKSMKPSSANLCVRSQHSSIT